MPWEKSCASSLELKTATLAWAWPPSSRDTILSASKPRGRNAASSSYANPLLSLAQGLPRSDGRRRLGFHFRLEPILLLGTNRPTIRPNQLGEASNASWRLDRVPQRNLYRFRRDQRSRGSAVSASKASAHGRRPRRERKAHRRHFAERCLRQGGRGKQVSRLDESRGYHDARTGYSHGGEDPRRMPAAHGTKRHLPPDRAGSHGRVPGNALRQGYPESRGL